MTEKLRFELSSARNAGMTGDAEEFLRKACAECGVAVSELMHIPAGDCYLFVADGTPSKPWPSYIVRPRVHGLNIGPPAPWQDITTFPDDGHTVEVRALIDGEIARAVWNTKLHRVELEPGNKLEGLPREWRDIP